MFFPLICYNVSSASFVYRQHSFPETQLTSCKVSTGWPNPIGQPFFISHNQFLKTSGGASAPSIYKDIIMPKGIGTYGSKRGRPPKKPKKKT